MMRSCKSGGWWCIKGTTSSGNSGEGGLAEESAGKREAARSIPPFAALRAFEAVGRLGGIRKAAVALSLHHAVVSRHLSALERWTGVILLDRGRDGGLTEAGRRYHARVTAAIAEIADATDELVPRRDEPHVRIWSNGGFAARWLGPQLLAFGARHGGIEIELRPSDAPPDLVAREADVDIRFFGDDYSPPPGGKGLKHVEIARPRILAVAGAELAQRLQGLDSVGALLAQPLLHEESDAQWRAWLSAFDIALPDRIEGVRLWHAHLALDAAIKGQGIALASLYLVADDLAAGRLVEILPDDAKGREIRLGSYVFTTREDRWATPWLARLRHWLRRAASY